VIPVARKHRRHGAGSQRLSAFCSSASTRRKARRVRRRSATVILVAGNLGRSLTTGRPVMRCRPLNLAAVLMFDMDHVPGALPLVATNKTFGGPRFFRRPRPRPFNEPDQRGERGAREPWRSRRKPLASAGAAGLPACWSCCGSSRSRRWLREHSVDSAVTLRRLLETWRALVGRTQADPGLCARALSGNAFHRDARRMSRSRLMGVSRARGWPMHGVVRFFGTVVTLRPGDLTRPLSAEKWWALHSSPPASTTGRRGWITSFGEPPAAGLRGRSGASARCGGAEPPGWSCRFSSTSRRLSRCWSDHTAVPAWTLLGFAGLPFPGCSRWLARASHRAGPGGDQCSGMGPGAAAGRFPAVLRVRGPVPLSAVIRQFSVMPLGPQRWPGVWGWSRSWRGADPGGVLPSGRPANVVPDRRADVGAGRW